MTSSAISGRATEYLIDAATAQRDAAHLVFLEVAPWRVMADGPDPVLGSIPGAVATTVKDDFAGSPTATSGHLPLPHAGDLHAVLRAYGVQATDDIVVYTRRTEELSSATRAWFTLTWAGYRSVRVLDGGLPAWVGTGGRTAPLEPPRTRPPAPAPLAAGAVRVLDVEQVLEISQYGTLLDARSAAAYNGSLDEPRSGHVPHAVHAPSTDLVGPDGRLVPATELRKWFLRRRAVGGQEVGAYCGGGVSSSLLVFGAALIGQPIGLYVDSWSAWSADSTLPIEQGTTLSPSPLLDTDCT
ncbi:sulfurtransferase [Kribbella sp. NPDC004875]|uniref:sulfurtransferase n=1 Tax=Kribbella sp. NPDC004875 TaxID=3364107 RepID=UPI0036CA67C5